ncbi:PREDICTED: probable phospholipid-transporting ATPase VD [Thamnophis sirtalis]|uniref:Probable phospholipid-transporting ATPase VD n=1 Tax=Thamnophis sirtalis TaxID=35019 RepID=A0A6I9YDL6_9SAUR|nr:PREDICTED: probable phospholipid-transporting ATPase VD [Thamnophis sirtalis]
MCEFSEWPVASVLQWDRRKNHPKSILVSGKGECVLFHYRVANLYFLFIALLNWVPAVEAFRKEVTMIPLCVVLTIIAVKDGLEDYTKYKLDKKINNFITRTYCSGKELAPELGGFLMFWTMIILLQVLIPISLYVSIEFVKLGHIYLIRNDIDLYDEASDRKIQCGSLNIAEDLGQIEYIFSDKTGTLTENKMVFRRCSIAGLEYGHEENAKRLEMYQDYEEEDDEAAYFASYSSLRHSARARFFSRKSNELLNSRVFHSSSSFGLGGWRQLAFSSPLRRWSSMVKMPALNLGEFKNIFQRLSSRKMSSQGPDSSGGRKEKPKKSKRLSVHVNFPSSPAQLSDTLEMPAASPSPKMPDILRLPDDRLAKLSYESLSGQEICYEAESPDEAALVHAARAYQCTLKTRSPEQVQIDFAPLGTLTFQLLHILPFDSTRKRMSVVVKHPMFNQVVVYTKGADTTIMNLLDVGLTGTDPGALKL